MIGNFFNLLGQYLLIIILIAVINGCSETTTTEESHTQITPTVKYPSDVIPFMDEFKILLGDGTNSNVLVNYEAKDFFFTTNDGTTDWIVYKTPNSGTTSKNSSNTRTELHQKKEWIPETGGKLTGTCKVMHVSTSGDARVAATFSTVVGQIHSGEGHELSLIHI